MLDRNTPIPLYYQLKLILKEQIDSGVLQPGDQLPTERELCEQYQVSRAPVRQALQELVQEDYVYRRPGMGTFVTPQATLTWADPQQSFRLWSAQELWLPLLKRLFATWNQTHPSHHLLLELKTYDQVEFHQFLGSAAAQGAAPDLVSLDFIWLMGYARSSYIVPLDEVDAPWTAEVTQTLEPVVRRNHLIDGQLYGFPLQVDVTGLWYRRDWFRQEALSPPTTWDAWLEVLAHFDRADVKARFGHRHALALPGGLQAGEATVNLLLSLIWSGGAKIDDAAGKVSLTQPRVYRALRFVQALTFEHRYVPAAAVDYEWQDAPRLLAQGGVPMSLGGTYELPFIRQASRWGTEEALREHLGFVPIPHAADVEAPVASLGGTTLSILHQSELQQLSLQVLKHAFDSEDLVRFYGDTLQISPFRSVNRALGQSHPWLREILPLLAIARPRPMLEQYVQVSRLLQQMSEQILWQGAPVEETVQQATHYLNLF